MTETINGKSYFYINRNVNLSPYAIMRLGDVVDIGASINPFFRFYEIYKRTYQVTDKTTGAVHDVPAIDLLRQIKNGTIISDQLPTFAYETAQHFLMLARELVWENVRLAEFPEAPSRQRCIWLVESLNDVKRWTECIGCKPNEYSLVRVHASGRALHVDGNYLASDSEPLPVWVEKARAYWSGKKSPNPITEVLFEGNIEVAEIVDPSQL